MEQYRVNIQYWIGAYLQDNKVACLNKCLKEKESKDMQ